MKETGVTGGNRYSRFIGGVKLALPLAALGVVSSLFLVPQGSGPGAGVPYADMARGAQAGAPAGRLVAPSYSGVTRDGAAISLTAERAAPEAAGSDAIAVEGIRTRIETAGGRATDIRAGGGVIDSAAGWAELSGGVTMTTSGGFRVETPALRAALDRVAAASRGTVQAEGPPGRLAAGRMRVEAAAAGGPPDLIFENGVTLRYEPGE